MTKLQAIIATGDRDVYGDVLMPEALKMFAEQAPGVPITFFFQHEVGRIEGARLDGDKVVVEGEVDLNNPEISQELFKNLHKVYVAPAFTTDADGNPKKLVSVGIVAHHADPAVPPAEFVVATVYITKGE